MATYTRTNKKFVAAVYNQAIGDGKEDFVLDELQAIQKVEDVEVIVLPVFTGVVDITHDTNEVVAPNYMLGVLAHDEQDGNITHKIVVDDSAVNLDVLGIYDLIYTVADSMDNEASAAATVTVIDAVVPVIAGMVDITHEFGDPNPNYAFGVTATDGHEGDLTADMVIDASAVNLAVLGDYTVTYTVADSSGNVATETITVSVVDTEAPVIAGMAPMAWTSGDADPDYEFGVTATDNYDGDLTANIVINAAAVDYTISGPYNVTYTVADSSGNVTTETIVMTITALSYTVTYNLNGGEIDGITTDVTVLAVPYGTLVGAAYNEAAPTKAIHTWTTPYWVTTAIGSEDAASLPVTADITVYAYWVAN